MGGGGPTVAIYDLDVGGKVADMALIQTWLNTLSINTVYGWSVVPIGNSRFRYTILYV